MHFIKPQTQYTKSGSINIAYQVFGSGPIDLVYIPGWVSNIDWMWACPELVDFLQELGKVARVILFDKRGTGLSDRIVELSTIEERMDDIRAVMDATDSKKAVLFGHSEGGSVSALFAATYPERCISLISFGIFARRRYCPEYPWAPTDEERQEVYDMIEHSWGSGEMNLASLAPSKAQDKTFMDWLANYFRSGASPSAAMVLTKMNTQVDIIDILSSIKVPSLILQRTHDIDVKIEEGRFIAERIEGAKFVELEGEDHLFWVGDSQRVLDEIRAFLKQVQAKKYGEKRLYSFLAAHYCENNPKQPELDRMIDPSVVQYKGKLVQHNCSGFIAAFDGPSKAIQCAQEIRSSLSHSSIRLSFAVHIQEASISDLLEAGNQVVASLDRMLKISNSYEILLTQTVKYLLSGAGLSFSPRTAVFSSTYPNSTQFYVVSDPGISLSSVQPVNQQQYLRQDSFLEKVLQCIENHLSDELFGVEMLCREIGLSERQLQRKLKAITNKSPIKLICSVRLHRAKELLLKQEDNIAEISYQTGFLSPSYFSTCFKKEFGMSPSSLLRNEQNSALSEIL
ncbi:MAG: alpha/beta fold hydrolase [Bacteroidota bacterium]